MSTTLLAAGTPLLVFLVYTFLNFLKSVRTAAADNGNAAISQLIAWVAPIGAMFLFRGSQLGDTVAITDSMTLAQLNGWTTALVGILIGSGASAFYDLTKAFDNSNSATKPLLIPPTTP